MQYEVAQSDLVRRNKAAGPARNLHRERFRMAGPKRLNHCTGLNGPSHQTDPLIQASVGGQSGKALESSAHLIREVARHRGNDALCHRSVSFGAAPLPSRNAAGTVAALGGVRLDRR